MKKANKNGASPQAGDKQKLTFKQRRFCLAYIGEASGNGAESARLAGYKGNDLTLRVVAHENLMKPYVAEFIRRLRAGAEKLASGKILSATEVLVGLTRIAEADIAEVFESDGSFDLVSAKKRNASRLIKSLSFDKDSGRVTKVELHNAHGAHVDLGKYHKLFVDKFEIVQPEDLDAALERELQRLTGVPTEEIEAKDDAQGGDNFLN